MVQVRLSRRVQIAAGIALGLVFVTLQGLVIFAWWGFTGSFLSTNGLTCVGAPLLVEAVVAIVSLKTFDELHMRASANPHSPLSRSLLNTGAHRPEPPPARDAWSGGFESVEDAAHKLSKDR